MQISIFNGSIRWDRLFRYRRADRSVEGGSPGGIYRDFLSGQGVITIARNLNEGGSPYLGHSRTIGTNERAGLLHVNSAFVDFDSFKMGIDWFLIDHYVSPILPKVTARENSAQP
jgi:hypothetical protein